MSPSHQEIASKKTSQSKGPKGVKSVVYHSVNGYTSERIPKQKTERTGMRKRTSNTQEKTGTDGTAESDELDMSGFQTGGTSLAMKLEQVPEA